MTSFPTLYSPRRWLMRIASLLAAIALGASLLVAVARPAAAHIPPLTLCTPYNVGDVRIQVIGDGTEDYIRWTCTKGKTEPVVYYWRMSIHSADPQTELKRVARLAVIKVGEAGIWQGVIQSGFAAWPAGQYDRSHTRYVGSFDIRSWGGTPLNRDMDVYMIAKKSVDGGATWSRCAETGWVGPSTAKSEFDYYFWRLTSDCGPLTRLYTRARFFKLSTGTWWSSGWVQAGPADVSFPF